MHLTAFVVPYDSGFAGRRMGAGPTALIDAGVLDAVRSKGADVSITRYDDPVMRAEVQSSFAIARWLSSEVRDALAGDSFPVIFSGNCSSSLGTCAAIAAHAGAPPGVCWFDAHADLNTPDNSPSGYFDGMALAALTGRCWKQLTGTISGFASVPESQVVLLGARDLDPGERDVLRTGAVHWLEKADDRAAVSSALAALRGRRVYLHVDVDVIDAAEARANAYASSGGITGARLAEIVRELAKDYTIAAASFTAYDPSCDPDGRIPAIVTEIITTLVDARR